MKKLTTIISCSMLLIYGLLVGINNRADPGVTANAAPAAPVIGALPYDLQQSHMKRDTVYITKMKKNQWCSVFLT